jgi:hypothetical protein
MSKTKVKISPMIEQGNLEPRPIEKEHIEIANTRHKLSRPAMVISRLNYPITVNYDKSVIRLSPRDKVKVADKSLLGSLPVGVTVKDL